MTTTSHRPGEPAEEAGPVPAAPAPEHRPPPLARVNPLAKIAVTLPPMAFLLFTRDPWTPALVIAAALPVLVVGARPRPRLLLLAGAGGVLAVLWTAFVFSLVADASTGAATPVVLDLGPLTLRRGEAEYGAAAALRIASLLVLAWVGGAGTTGDGLAGALVRQLRVPYRFAHGAVAVLRFVPRFRTEARTIRAAHRVRGVPEGRGPVGRVRAVGRLLIPLLAGAIRHAERVSLAMDARGFGAYPVRRERHPVRFGAGDALYWAVGTAVFSLLVWFSAHRGWLIVVASAWQT